MIILALLKDRMHKCRVLAVSTIRRIKTVTFYFILCLCGAQTAFSQDVSYSDKMNALWSRDIEGIKQVSETRLKENKHDIVGLILRLEYVILYSNFTEIENTKDELVSAIRRSESERLIERIPKLEKQIELVMKVEAVVPPDVLEKGRQRLDSGYDTKGMLSLLYIDLLRICEDEGLVSLSDRHDGRSTSN